MRNGFYSNARQTVQFPGSLTIYGQTVYSFGTNSAGDNGLLRCITPGAANWGDPANANNRNGQVYASYRSSDVAAGIAWYWIDRVRPDKQPARGQSGVQFLGGAWLGIKWNFDGYITVRKGAAQWQSVADNPNYSLDNTAFGVYRSYEDAQNFANEIQRISLSCGINDSGEPYGNGSVLLPQGTYYVREVSAGIGYSLNPTIFTANVNRYGFTSYYGGQGVVDIHVLNKPQGAPAGVLVKKLDATTGSAYGQDDPTGQSLAGAQFRVDFYNRYFSSAESAASAGVPTRSLVIETAPGGEACLSSSYLVPGSDNLYLNELGEPFIPLGTVLIQEIKAPSGYLLPVPISVEMQQIRLDGFGGTTTLNPISVLEEPHTLTIEKTDAQSGKKLAGAEFELYMESCVGAADWQLIVTKTTDENGVFSYSPIKVGSYKLVETKAPLGYMLPDEAGQSLEHLFVIGEDTQTLKLAAVNYQKRQIAIDKLDKNTSKPVRDTEFSIYSYPVMIKDGQVSGDTSMIKATDDAWQKVAVAVTDEDGKAVFAGLPFGYYKLEESRSNPEYADYAESGGADRFVKLDKFSTDEAQVFEDMAIQVSVEVYKKTIAITSSGLDGTSQAARNNVGEEEYLYHFGARSNSNVWVDEFIITDDLSFVTSEGYRMTTLWTGTSPIGMDYDNKMAVLYKTNMTDEFEAVSFAQNPLAANPHNPNNPNKNMSYSNSPGWRIWQEGLSTTRQSRLDVSALGLADGEYITGLKAVYGGVKKGFFSGRGWIDEADPHTIKALSVFEQSAIEHWSYSVVATGGLLPQDEFGEETVMRGSIKAELARNDAVLTDSDNDAVETRVIEPFMFGTKSNGLVGSSFVIDAGLRSTPTLVGTSAPTATPKTGDAIWPFLIVAALSIAGLGVLKLGAARSQRQRRRDCGLHIKRVSDQSRL